MGGIIAVHRKVAPAPQQHAATVDTRAATTQASYVATPFGRGDAGNAGNAGNGVNASVAGNAGDAQNAGGLEDRGGTGVAVTSSAEANATAKAQRRSRRRRWREHLRNNPRTEYVVCVGNARLLGHTTLTLDPRLNLQNLRIIVEELSEKNDLNRQIYPQEGKFLFLLPDKTPCPRAWEYDSSVTDVCWSVRGGSRIVVISDMPNKKPGDADSEEEHDGEGGAEADAEDGSKTMERFTWRLSKTRLHHHPRHPS